MLESHFFGFSLAFTYTLQFNVCKHKICEHSFSLCLASHSFVSSLFSFQGTPSGEHFAHLRWAFRTVCATGCSLLVFWLLAVRIFSFRDYVSCDSQLLKRGLLPAQPVVGSNGLEPSTSRLSGVRSNHLSYEPMFVAVRCHFLGQPLSFRPVSSLKSG